MKLFFNKPVPEDLINLPPFIIRPLDSTNMQKEAKRLDLSPKEWCYALVHDKNRNEIVLAEVFPDGLWCYADKSIIDKKVFDLYRKEEGGKLSFKQFQRNCFAESVYNTIIELK